MAEPNDDERERRRREIVERMLRQARGEAGGKEELPAPPKELLPYMKPRPPGVPAKEQQAPREEAAPVARLPAPPRPPVLPMSREEAPAPKEEIPVARQAGLPRPPPAPKMEAPSKPAEARVQPPLPSQPARPMAPLAPPPRPP